ncbi:hypothetical protein H0H92_005506 [Tricholoma furcatifolium]|nr:hypothetical protein H0H92_005506 [Tricholoma furcatifolium]
MPAIEEPLQSYSSEELEKWVLNRRSAELAWGLDGQIPRERKLEIPPVCPWVLVPGGRWLLAVMHTGALNSYDLDQENIVSTQLTLPHNPPRFMYGISIDMMLTATLSFNLVLYSDDTREFHIYKVDLKGHGLKAHLQATLLNSFEAPGSGLCFSALCGDFFAQSTGRCVEIFNWRLSTSTEHHKTVVYPGFRVSMVQLLPNNRLILCGPQIRIYTLDVQKVEPSVPSPHDPTRPQWKSDDNYSFVEYHYLGVSSASDVVILTSKEMFYRLTIPLNRTYDAHLSEAGKMGRDFRYPLLGSEKVLAREGQGLTKISLQDLEPKSTTGLRLSSFVSSMLSQRQLIGDFIPMLLDEQSGRILLYDDRITILDTSLYP